LPLELDRVDSDYGSCARQPRAHYCG
jgi:hypothetical protein